MSDFCNPTPLFAGRALFFDGKLIPEESWPKEKRYLYNNLRCYVLFIHNTGTAPARVVKVKAHAKDGSGIGFHQFNVEKLVVCDRLSTETDEDKSITATWKYLNPNDLIELYVVATGTHERADIAIDVDGDGIAVRETFPLDPIKLLNPMKSALIKLDTDRLLAKYLELLICVASDGDEMPKG